MLERWRKQKGIDGDQWSSFVEEGAQCDCGTGEGGGESSSGESSSGESKSSIDASSFIEEHEQDTGQDTGQEAEHEKEREELYNLNDLYGPGDSGGANGGPIAKIEPKVRDAVMEGLLSNCMPQLQQDLAGKEATTRLFVCLFVYVLGSQLMFCGVLFHLLFLLSFIS